MVSANTRACAVAVFLVCSCTFERNNPYDPNGERYRPLTAPEGVTVSVEGDSLRLVWVDRNTHEYGYLIFCGPDSVSLPCIDTVEANRTSYAFLAPDHDTLFCAVGAYATPGEEAVSEAFVLLPPILPAAPSEIRALLLAESRVALSWQCATPCTDSLLIVRTESTAAETLVIDSVAPGTTAYVDSSSLRSAAVYRYHLAGFRGDTLSPMSASDSVRTGVVAPFAPDSSVIALYHCDAMVSGAIPNALADSPVLVSSSDSLGEGRFGRALFLEGGDSAYCEGFGSISYPFSVTCFLRPARDPLPSDTMVVWAWEDGSLRLTVAGTTVELSSRGSVIARLASPMRANRWASVQVIVGEGDMVLAAGYLQMSAVRIQAPHPMPHGRFRVGGGAMTPFCGWRGGLDELCIMRE